MPERLKVLVVTYGTPYPPNSGVSIRDFNLLKRISGSVSLYLCILATERPIPDISELKGFCTRVIVVPAVSRNLAGNFTNSIRCWVAGYPLASHPYFYPELARAIRSIVNDEGIDILQIEHSFLVAYRTAVSSTSRCRTILSLHNIGSQQYLRIAKTQRAPVERAIYRLKSLLIRWMETASATEFDRCIVVSTQEGLMLKAIAPTAQFSVVENGVDCTDIRPLAQPGSGNDLLFIGVIGYPPNADAVVYFCKSVLPLIRSAVPDARVIVVGHAPPREVRELSASDAVVVTGSVENPVSYYKGCRVCVVPLRAGGGTRLKILEAMAFGRPVVTTSVGCEGLEVMDGEHLLIGDTPETFAENVIKLLRRPELSLQISGAARRLVEQRYDWSVIAPKLLEVYRTLTVRDPSAYDDAPAAR